MNSSRHLGELVHPARLVADQFRTIGRPRLHFAWDALRNDWQINYSLVEIEDPISVSLLESWRLQLSEVCKPARVSVINLTMNQLPQGEQNDQLTVAAFRHLFSGLIDFVSAEDEKIDLRRSSLAIKFGSVATLHCIDDNPNGIRTIWEKATPLFEKFSKDLEGWNIEGTTLYIIFRYE